MNPFTLIALVIVIVGIIHDYKRDPGKNIKAKVFHAICLLLICSMYANTIGAIIVFLKHIETTYKKYSVAVGVVPGALHFIIYLLHLALALGVLISALRMTKRSRKAKMALLYLFPFLALVEVFSFYRGWSTAEYDELTLSPLTVLLMGLAVYGSIAVAVAAIYNSKFMNVFFDTPSQMEKSIKTIDLTTSQQLDKV